MKAITPAEQKQILLSILIKIDELCRKNDIDYYLFAGTLIGAVRHKGFIPWDDDIDIAVPRNDYIRLIQIVNDADVGLHFIYEGNAHDYIYPFGKIYDTSTLIIEHDYRKVDNLGIYVDVFPLDEQGQTEEEARKVIQRARVLNLLLMESNLKQYHRFSKSILMELPKLMMYPYAKIRGTKHWLKAIDANAQKYNGQNTKFYGCTIDPNYHTFFQKEWFDKSVDIEFEGRLFSAPAGYDAVLKTNYGDYMRLPPEEKRVSHHNSEAFYR